MSKQKKQVDKEFGLSSWAIDNQTTMYVLIVVILILGAMAYFSMPRESFPEVKETKIYISSIYPGNTAEDIEKLITDPLEDELKSEQIMDMLLAKKRASDRKSWLETKGCIIDDTPSEEE